MASYAILTNVGRNKEAIALANNTALTLTHIAWGDGDRNPGGGETGLLNEQGRKVLSDQGVVQGGANLAYFETLIPESEGPYIIQEAGLFDSDGDMIAVARYDPVINKSLNHVSVLLRINVVFSNLENLVLNLVPSSAYVPADRAITAGTGLTGGGNLTQDRTVAVDFASAAEALDGARDDKAMSPAAGAAQFEDRFNKRLTLQSNAIADETALNAVNISSTWKFAKDVLRPPLAIGGILEHVELSDGSAVQKAYRITPSGLFLTKHIRTRRTGIWSAWAADGPEIGQIVTMAFSASVPSRLDALGAELSRTSYADLFDSVGTSFGVGDGATTFALPATVEKFIRGWDGVSGFALTREGTWIRTLASEWSGLDVPSGTTYSIGTAYAQADDVLSNTGVGGAVPNGAKASSGANFNLATTDNFMRGTSHVANDTTNRWIKMAPDHLVLKQCIVF